MSSGKVHDQAVTGLSVFFLLNGALSWAGLSQVDTFTNLSIGLGALSGLLLSPDLDLSENAAKGKASYKIDPLKRWGPFWILWYPYGVLILHRSPFSHWPALGTIIRVGYLWTFFFFMSYSQLPDLLERWQWVDSTFGSMFDRSVLLSLWRLPVAPWAFLGLCLADTVHLVLDYLPKP